MKKIDFKGVAKVCLMLVMVMCVAVGCDDDDDTTTTNSTSSDTKTYNVGKGSATDTTITLANGYDGYVEIHGYFYFHYYWNKNIPNTFTESFYKKFSSIEDMVESFFVSKDDVSYVKPYEDNSSVDNGFYYITHDVGKYVYLIIELVHENCPFKAAGLHRGCAITKINGKKLTKNNYEELLDVDNKTITFVEMSLDGNGDFQFDDNEITTSKIASHTINWSPILLEKKIETPVGNVGYILFRSDALSDSTAISEAFQNMQTMDIDELVLDMRLVYGGWIGGEKLASYIVPSSKIGKPFLSYQYNNRYGLIKNKIPKPAYNLDVTSVYILTDGRTQLCPFINGIQQYIDDLTIIGSDCEYDGDYYFRDDLVYKKEISFRIVEGEVLDRDGDKLTRYTADYEVEDTYCIDLGDPSEPLLAKALQLINE